MNKFQNGDRVKVIATQQQQEEIAIYSINLKGKVGVVVFTYCDGGGVGVKFNDGESWHMPSCYVYKVVE